MLLAWSVERLFLRRAKYWGQHPVFGRQEQDIYLYGGGGYILICEWAHAWAHVWRPGDKPAVLPRGCSTLNFERGSHWPGYHQPVQVGGLAQESQKSSCLCLPNSETISVHQNSQTLVCALRSWLHIGSKSDVSK